MLPSETKCDGEGRELSPGDISHNISIIGGIITIYSSEMERLYGPLCIWQGIIDSPSIRDGKGFFLP